MNKDVIYIEPEDDITDIINKIENSKQKIVALVPPKKAGILRSIVNIKLIAKAGSNTSKSVVLVTADPSIIKLAAAAKLPVTKDLQSAPSVPKIKAEDIDETVVKDRVIEKVDNDGEEKVVIEETDEKAEGDSDEENVAEEKEDDGEKTEAKNDVDNKKDKKKQKKDKKLSSNPFVEWLQTHKLLWIGGGIGLIVLILVLVWAFGIAPAATVTVGVRTTKNNFSENVTFTEKLTEENAGEGKFFLEQKKLEDKSEVKFSATGEKNIGEKAKGNVVIYSYFPITGGESTISTGANFKIGDLVYTADETVTISWEGDLTNIKDGCENGNNNESLKNLGCLIYGRVNVTAVAAGKAYNIEASSTGWKAPVNVSGAYSDAAMTGGSDKIIKIVTQADIDKAISSLESSDLSVEKEKLFDQLSESSFAIEPSFKQSVGDAVSTPKIGEEVKEGEKAKLSVTTTYSIYYIDKTKVEEFIQTKAKLAENFKIYNIDNPFIENFIKTDTGYTGKLKATYVSGPKVTENDVIEIIKGKGLGTAQHDLKDIDGISSIRIDPSYPWVSSIPSDPNKITVILDIEE